MDYAAPISFTQSDIFHIHRSFHIGLYIYLQEKETTDNCSYINV